MEIDKLIADLANDDLGTRRAKTRVWAEAAMVVAPVTTWAFDHSRMAGS